MKLNELISVGEGVLCIKYDKLYRIGKSVDALCVTMKVNEEERKRYCFESQNNESYEAILVEIKEKLNEKHLKEAIDQITCSKSRIDAKIRRAFILLSDCSKAKTAQEDKMLLEAMKQYKIHITNVCLDVDEVKDESTKNLINTATELS
ncbi:hypothetical protein [Sulfolobus acidocaldarius]|uniref:Uncharacterized protein n=4 Tax=Sulfolobus acidocaldarius TaxID=2285 RepID=Q4J7N8_SULAC|nr:hypothetical protein [Sulfolobus acidocaldarius]AAY81193.1 hypothetical protein Saci_1888 [Sulfolobus acidocaldarius DSM 639]AGE71812.1 hypothetical protein SacN8_09260 [Sulfolobus acidocaldarius N8]AGE74083.1 hypothetical protein SacRon12I_09280 [Sulfolobus acidocaldarius Ron12/I]ALU29994.1 hypothetical protein ATY89_08655 [Sulfolobus acidocaldarius]ALU30684.1 hypothetical protein ATZ20_00065 [Sulfolobus acidocaldarius]